MLSGNDKIIDNIHWYTYIYIDNFINRIMLLLQIKIQIVTQVYLYICMYSHI